jgi:hypothetical protein
MKSVNRKAISTLLGIVFAAPFLVVAAIVGLHAAALANVRADWTFLGLALASVVVSVVNGHGSLTVRTDHVDGGCVEHEDNSDLRGTSSVSLGY